MWYWIFRALFIFILEVFFDFKIEGLENLPDKSNYIVAANHNSYLDTLVVGAAIPKRTCWIAHKFLYKVFWLRWFLNMIGTLPSGSSSDEAIALLDKNRNVGLFPEGKMSPNGKLGKFRRGVALLAFRTGRPVVPCAILGTYKALPQRARFPKLLLPIKIKIGKPIYLLKGFDEVVDDMHLQEGIFRIRNSIKEMIDAR